ncbi:MAG: hypothetical protein ACSHX8_05550 [Opitutaceae bacterium]
MKRNEKQISCWALACILGASSIACPVLLVLLRLDTLVPSAILSLSIFSVLAVAGSFLSNERKRHLSLIGLLLSLALPLFFLLEPYFPSQVQVSYTDPKTGNGVRIVQNGKVRTIYVRDAADTAQWKEISEAEFHTLLGERVNVSSAVGLSTDHSND